MSISDFLDKSFGRGRKKEGATLPSASEFKQTSKSLTELSKGIRGLVEGLSRAAKEIENSASASEKAAIAQVMYSKSQDKTTKSTEVLTDQLTELNKGYSSTADSTRDMTEATKEAGKENEQLNEILEKAKGFLKDNAARLGIMAIAMTQYTAQVQAATRARDAFSKGGERLGSAPTSYIEAHIKARDLKIAYDGAGQAAVRMGLDQEKGFEVMNRSMDKLGMSVKDLGTAKGRHELDSLTEDVLALNFALGQDTDQTMGMIETFERRFGKDSKDTRKEMYLIRGAFDDMKESNKNLTMTSQEYSTILNEQVMGTKNYNSDLGLMSKILGKVTADTEKFTGSQEKAISVSKEIMGVFEEPPAWLDFAVSENFLDEAIANLDAFLKKYGLEDQREEYKKIVDDLARPGGTDRLQAKDLMGNKLRSGPAFNQAIIEKAEQAGAFKDIRKTASHFSLSTEAAVAMNDAFHEGVLTAEKFDELTGKRLSKEQELAKLAKESAAALNRAADDGQGIGKQFESFLRSDYGLLAGGVLAMGGMKFGGKLLGGAFSKIGGIFSKGAGGGGGPGGSGKKKGILGGLFDAVTGAGRGGKAGPGGGCCNCCCGGSEGVLDDLTDVLEGGAGGRGGKGRGKPKGRGGGKPKGRFGRMFSKVKGMKLGGMAKLAGKGLAGVSAVMAGFDVAGILDDDTMATDEKTAAISDSVGEAGLAMATMGVSTVLEAVMGETYDKGKKAIVTGLSDSLLRMTGDSKKHRRGTTDKEKAMGGLKYRDKGPTSAQKLMAKIIWEDGAVKPEFAWFGPEYGGRPMTDELSREVIRRAQKQQMGAMTDKQRGRINKAVPHLIDSSNVGRNVAAAREKFGAGFASYAYDKRLKDQRAYEQHRMIKSLKLNGGKLDNQGNMKGTAEFEFQNIGPAILDVVEGREKHKKRANTP